MKTRIKMTLLFLLLSVVTIAHTISHNDSIINIYNCGINNMRNGNIKTAIDDFQYIERWKNINEDKKLKQAISYLLMCCFFADNQSDKAISYGERVLEMSNIQGEEYSEINNILLLSYNDLGDINSAKKIALNIENSINTPLPNQLKFTCLVNLVSFYTQCKDYDKVESLSKKAEELIAKIKNLTDVDDKSFKININTLYMSLMSYYEEICNYDKKIQYGEKALYYITPETENNKLLLFVDLSTSYFQVGKIEEAKKFIDKAMDIINNKAIDNPDYTRVIGIAFQTLADLLIEDYNNIEAINWYQKAIEKYQELNEDEFICYCHSKLYDVYKNTGHISEANKMEELILDRIKNIKGKNKEVTAIVLSAYGDILLKRNNIKKALEAYYHSINLKIQIFGKKHRDLIRSYLGIANAYYLKKDYEQARTYINKAIEVASYNENCNDGYVQCILLLSDIAIDEGNIGEAISLLESMKSQVDVLDKKSPIKYDYYYKVKYLYSYVGNNETKIDSIHLNYIQAHVGVNSKDYAITLINNSSNLRAEGDYIEAAKECQKGLEILKDNKLSRTEDYHDALRKQAFNIVHIDSLKARNIIDSCIVLASNLFGEQSVEYGEDLILSVMLSPSYLKDKLSAIQTFHKGVNIKRNAGADNTLGYFSELRILSTWYAYVFNDYESSYEIDRECFIKTKEYVKDNFCNLRNSQRIGLWNHLKDGTCGLIVKARNTLNDEFIKLAYDEALLRKNLLLNSNTSLRNIILKSGNKEAITSLNTYLSLLSSDCKEDTSILDTNEIGRIERDLINIAQSYGTITDFIDIDWTDIRNSLLPNEAAIEFVEDCANDGTCNYSALVLNWRSTSPHLIPLFNSSELNQLEDKDTGINYNNPHVYRLIWSNLEKYGLKDIETIYFSADGLVHKIAIENLIDNNGIYAYEKWNLKRLSSTRELINRNVKYEINNYILYGGLDYEASMKSNNSNLRSTRCVDYNSLRAGFSGLPGTKMEINDIAKILKGNNINYRLMEGAKGTEESFKRLSGSNFHVIHLATHGFFWTEDESKNKNSRILSSIDSNNQNAIDDALCRSGVVFSGSNNVLKNINIPDDRDDGILTADEISQMVLNSVDMVVLSACQTGLGDINSEGVYGLQRGFKLAGVNSLLMSLWKVADDSTQLLMTEFYKALLNGKSKQESLDYAKMYLREKGYTDPLEWAAWILLDGI